MGRWLGCDLGDDRHSNRKCTRRNVDSRPRLAIQAIKKGHLKRRPKIKYITNQLYHEVNKMNKEQKRQAELIKEMIMTFKVDLATNIQEKVVTRDAD